MTQRELWIQLRRLILCAVAILDKYYAVGKYVKVVIAESDNIAAS